MSLDAVGIVSGDIERTKKFYAILGVHFEERGGPDHLEANTSSGIRIMLDSEALMKKLVPDWKAPERGGISLCFKQTTPALVDEIYSKIIEAGFQGIKAPWDAFWGQRYACIADPSGNQIDLFAAL